MKIAKFYTFCIQLKKNCNLIKMESKLMKMIVILWLTMILIPIHVLLICVGIDIDVQIKYEKLNEDDLHCRSPS